MHPTLPSRLALLTLGCALLSAALWVWSRGLPEPNWESSTVASALAATPTPSPAEAVAVAPAPSSTPKPKLKSKPKPKPAPVIPDPTPVVAEATPIEPVPSATPTTPEPTPVIAEATPAATPATPEPSPRPTDAELAGPLPEHSPGEAPATAAAPPVPLEIGDIARQPRLWPPQVILLRTQRFPVVIKGVNVGNVQVPAGRPVTLRKVNTDGTLEIEFQGSPAKVKAQATDLEARAAALAASPGKGTPAY